MESMVTFIQDLACYSNWVLSTCNNGLQEMPNMEHKLKALERLYHSTGLIFL